MHFDTLIYNEKNHIDNLTVKYRPKGRTTVPGAPLERLNAAEIEILLNVGVL